MDEALRREPSYGELLAWHLRRGTRPPPAKTRRWTVAEFADVAGFARRTVSGWTTGHWLPRNPTEIERALFGEEESEELKQLRRAHEQGLARIHRDNSKKSTNIPSIIRNIQSYVATTPLTETATVVSITFNVSTLGNAISNDIGLWRNGTEFDSAQDVDDFLGSLLLDLDNDREAAFLRLQHALDHEFAVLYLGSIKPVTTRELSRLPILLKGMASLSSRQFRVGLFRLGVSVVVLTVVATGAGALAWQVTDGLRQVGEEFIHQLSQGRDVEQSMEAPPDRA